MVDKAKILEKVLQSSEFKESSRNQELLQYLVASSEKDEQIKETTIAADLFSKDSNFDPHDDPTIRVYISNLRKKLEHYYLTEGKEDPVRIQIPKGRYNVVFTCINNKKNKFQVHYKYLTLGLLIPMIIIMLAIIIFQKKHIDSNKGSTIFTEQHPVWGDILKKSESPTLLVFGDYFFLFEKRKQASGGYFVRDPQINSAEEFKQLLKKNPKLIEKFVECNFTYMGPSSAESMVYILPILLQSSNKVLIKLSSELIWEDLKSNNIIFIGTFKTLYELNQLISNFSFNYQISPPEIYLLNNNADTIQTFVSTQFERMSYKKDIGIIIKYTGQSDNTILLLTGFDELGVIESVKKISSPDFVDEINSYIPNFQDSLNMNFELFIEAEGIDRYAFKSDIINFRIFDSYQKKWKILQ